MWKWKVWFVNGCAGEEMGERRGKKKRERKRKRKRKRKNMGAIFTEHLRGINLICCVEWMNEWMWGTCMVMLMLMLMLAGTHSLGPTILACMIDSFDTSQNDDITFKIVIQIGANGSNKTFGSQIKFSSFQQLDQAYRIVYNKASYILHQFL